MSDQPVAPVSVPNKEAFIALLELDEKERSFKARQGYITAYTLSVILPPIGAYYFVKYLFFSDGTMEDRKAGTVCLVLTVVSLLASVWIMGLMFNQASPSIPGKGSGMIRELITPANQEDLKNLLR